ncbi:hypothetical protein AMQ83_32080, partial [Paenibacillus riograndensis]
MNQRRIARLLLPLIVTVLVLLSAAPPVQARAAQDTSVPQRVLLLYDSLGKGTVREGHVSELQRLLSAMGPQVTLLRPDHYDPGTRDSFTRVLTLMKAAGLG